MSEPDALPQADRLDGAPHPRETPTLYGQSDAEQAFLKAFRSGRLHHAWLITGPKGVGKATLAWRLVRFLLAEAPADAGMFGDALPARDSLDILPDHPTSRRITAGSEPRLFHLSRSWDTEKKKLRQVIGVDDVRGLKSFFSFSVTDGGRRVVLIDSIDELNVNAANALLKVLEEPPAKSTLLLVSHQPAGLLPTIRSRCRELRCAPLGPEDLAQALAQAGVETGGEAAYLAELAAGSVGDAVGLSTGGGYAIYQEITDLLATCPSIDRQRARALAEAAGARGKEARLRQTIRLLDLALTRLARTGTGTPPAGPGAKGEEAMLARLAPSSHAGRVWAARHQELGARAAHGLAVNLDPVGLILDMLLKINETAMDLSVRP